MNWSHISIGRHSFTPGNCEAGSRRFLMIRKSGEQARQLFEDAQKLLQDIVKGKLIIAKGVYGFWPANSVGDDIELYTDESRSVVLTTFHMLRQQMDKAG